MSRRGPSTAGFLLDVNVVSALRIRNGNPDVERWARSIPLASQFIAATTVAEIERGVIAKERTDRATLRRWLEDHVLPAFAGRVLPFDLSAARVLAT